MGKKDNNENIGFWTMVRDVFRSSIDNGQLLPVLFGAIIIIFLVRIPPEDLSKIAYEIIENLKNFYLVGWFLTILVSIIWVRTNRRIRKVHRMELERLESRKKKKNPKSGS